MSAKIRLTIQVAGILYYTILWYCNCNQSAVTLQKCKNLTNFESELALRFAKYTMVAHSILVRRFKLTLLGY